MCPTWCDDITAMAQGEHLTLHHTLYRLAALNEPPPPSGTALALL